MKKSIKIFFILIVFVITFQKSFSQEIEHIEKNAVTFGIFQGGGALIGIDLEQMVSKRIGLQIGAGILAFGAGINYHLKPTIRSPFLGLAYWHQGLQSTYTQSLLGPTFVWRSKKLFTAQLGIGFKIQNGPAILPQYENIPVMLIYSIGIYFPGN
jgi:hypothetical protein